MTVGTRVRDLRLQAGLTQRGLAHAVGTCTATIGRLERGLHDTRTPVLHKIARELGTSVSALLETEAS